MIKKCLAGLLFMASFEASAAAHVNLLDNGGFESYDVTDSYVHLATDCSGVFSPCVEDSSSWQPLASSPNEFLEIKDNFSNIDAYEGSNYAELTPLYNAAITQSFEAQAGVGSLSWWDHGRYGINYEYEVVLNGNAIFSGVTTDFDAWTKQQFEVSLLAGINTLSFISLSSQGNTMGANVDAVSVIQLEGGPYQDGPVSAVPEAETYWLMIVGFCMFVLLGRRKSYGV